MSALARAHRSASATAEHVLKHAKLEPAAYAFAAPLVQQIVRSHPSMQKMTAEQLAQIDEAVIKTSAID